jgi:hypothetical protein
MHDRLHLCVGDAECAISMTVTSCENKVDITMKLVLGISVDAYQCFSNQLYDVAYTHIGACTFSVVHLCSLRTLLMHHAGLAGNTILTLSNWTYERNNVQKGPEDNFDLLSSVLLRQKMFGFTKL